MFILSILVVWVHSFNYDLFVTDASEFTHGGWAGAVSLETFLGTVIGQIAVPGFFMISSWQFFRDFTWGKLLPKWKRRISSILVPYVVWNLLYYVSYMAASRVPALAGFVGRESVPFSISEIMRAILSYAYAPFLWFLFQLIILVILSPLIYVLVKNKLAGLVWIGILAAMIFFGIDTAHPNTDALFYYSLAAWGALHIKEFAEGRETRMTRTVGLGAMFIAVLCLFLMTAPVTNVLWTVLFRSSAFVSLWLLIPGGGLPEARPFMKMSLFFYADHYAIIRFVNKAAALLFADVLHIAMPWFGAAALYLILPVIAVAVSYAAARLLSRKCAPVWRVLSGGRELAD